MTTLHLLDRSGPGGAARELALVAAPGDAVQAIRGHGRLDPRPLWQLRGHRPERVIAWGLNALLAVRIAGLRCPVTLRRPMARAARPWALSPWQRWLARGVDQIVVTSQAERHACLTAGLDAGRIAVEAPRVALPEVEPEPAEPRIVCLGALERHKGFFDAIWAFDIVRLPHPTATLTIVGEGPERPRLEQFATTIEHGGRVTLPGTLPDAQTVLAHASVVWIPSLSDNGAGVALEAMAAGRPVIAARWPNLAEWIVDGECGFLTPPGDKAALARRTHQLLNDADLRWRMGQAARRRAEALCAPKYSSRSA